MNPPGVVGDQIAQRIGRIIATLAGFVDIGFQHIAGQIGIVLQTRQTGQQLAAARMNEESGRNAGIRITQKVVDGRPSGNPMRVGGLQVEAKFFVLPRHGLASAFTAEDIRTGDEREQFPFLPKVPVVIPLRARMGIAGQQIFPKMLRGGKHFVLRQHLLDGLRMALRGLQKRAMCSSRI